MLIEGAKMSSAEGPGIFFRCCRQTGVISAEVLLYSANTQRRGCEMTEARGVNFGVTVN